MPPHNGPDQGLVPGRADSSRDANACAKSDGIRQRSGSVNDTRPLVSFLYVLMRDHLVPGVVEGIEIHAQSGKEKLFCNGWLARHAQDLADRLTAKVETAEPPPPPAPPPPPDPERITHGFRSKPPPRLAGGWL